MGSKGVASRFSKQCGVSSATTRLVSRGGMRGPAQGVAGRSRVALTHSGTRPRLRAASGSSGTGETALLVTTGGVALALGLIVYLTDRDASRAALIPEVAALAGSNVFGALGQWLPAAVHPFAFSLLTAAALPPRLAWRYGACAAWCVVNIAFEVGQHPLFSGYLVSALQATSGQFVPGRAVTSYFLHGTFDAADIVAGAFGALLAAAFLGLTQHIWETDHAA